ncbi:MAG: GNAT family N-acetyltransferase [Chloroflexi bacterium]|nr:MAG: GNAT family N-acetyltransferase [Chloroflexota bacterium]
MAAMGEEGDLVARRFERGSRAFAIIEAGKVVSYGWLSMTTEWIGELGVEISPDAGEAYIWNCLTLSEHRRRGHYRALLEGIVAQARRDGPARLWIGSTEDPAQKADADAGFVTVLNFAVRRLAGLRWLSASPDARADPELVAAARRRLGMRSSTSIAADRRRVH